MKSIGRIALLGLLALAAPLAGLRAQDAAVGDWHGVLDTPVGALRVIVTIARDADGYRAEFQSPDQAPGRRVPMTSVTVADGRLAFTLRQIGASFEGEWVEAERHWVGEWRQGGSIPLTLERGAPPAKPVIEGLDGVWEGTLNRNGVDLRLVLRVRTDSAGTAVTLDSPDMGAMALPVAAVSRDGDRVAFEVPSAAVRFDGMLGAGGTELKGRWVRPSQPEAVVVFERTSRSSARTARERPQEPRPPFPYRVEEVSFANPAASGVTLAGTLTLPRGTGPFPAAILISGSGPQDRDETINGHKPFAVLADHLTRSGIAVLRYDDRGVGRSTGDHGSATSADFAADANAAARYLLGRPEIDGRAVGFVGHSEGGVVGPLAALDNPRIAFMVLLAAPGTSLARIDRAQRRLMGRSQGATERDLDRADSVLAGVMAAVEAASSREDAERRARALLTPAAFEALGIPEERREATIRLYTRDWLRYILRYDPARVLGRLEMPVLALNGSLDQQVPADENLAGIEAALARHPDATIRRLEGLNHMFQTATTGAMGEYADLTETFAPSALAIVRDWILARFGSAAEASSPG